MFEFQSKSSSSIEKARKDKEKSELQGEIHPRDREICSTYRDVRVSEYSSYQESTVLLNFITRDVFLDGNCKHLVKSCSEQQLETIVGISKKDSNTTIRLVIFQKLPVFFFGTPAQEEVRERSSHNVLKLALL